MNFKRLRPAATVIALAVLLCGGVSSLRMLATDYLFPADATTNGLMLDPKGYLYLYNDLPYDNISQWVTQYTLRTDPGSGEFLPDIYEYDGVFLQWGDGVYLEHLAMYADPYGGVFDFVDYPTYWFEF